MVPLSTYTYCPLCIKYLGLLEDCTSFNNPNKAYTRANGELFCNWAYFSLFTKCNASSIESVILACSRTTTWGWWFSTPSLPPWHLFTASNCSTRLAMEDSCAIALSREWSQSCSWDREFPSNLSSFCCFWWRDIVPRAWKWAPPTKMLLPSWHLKKNGIIIQNSWTD